MSDSNPPPLTPTHTHTSHGRGSVGVAEHGVEGVGQVVGLAAGVVLLRHGRQEVDHAPQQEQQEEVEGERHPEDTPQEQPGGGEGLAPAPLRTGGNGPNVAGRPVG